MGAIPPTPAMMFRLRTSRGPSARSTTTLRAVTIAQPPLRPWTKRATIISWIDGHTAHATEARVSTASDSSSGMRRPRVSETGPPTSWPSAIPTKNVVSVSCTCVAPASRSSPTRGKAGTYMSVASGAIELTRMIVASRARVSTTADAVGGLPAPAPVRARSTVWTVIESLSGFVDEVFHP